MELQRIRVSDGAKYKNGFERLSETILEKESIGRMGTGGRRGGYYKAERELGAPAGSVRRPDAKVSIIIPYSLPTDAPRAADEDFDMARGSWLVALAGGFDACF